MCEPGPANDKMEIDVVTFTAESKRAASEKTAGRLFVLDASVGGRIVYE